jgi:hypothetical protein
LVSFLGIAKGADGKVGAERERRESSSGPCLPPRVDLSWGSRDVVDMEDRDRSMRLLLVVRI